MQISHVASGFVQASRAVPDVLLEARYYTTYNFIGDRIAGYEAPCVMMTREAAEALSRAAAALGEQGYRLKLFDAYRPQRAVEHFAAWARDVSDQRMKPYFYPEVDKARLFALGYISLRSNHSRGSTVDLTLFDMQAGREADMGSPFDYFGEISHADYTGALTAEQRGRRALLRQTMEQCGFRGIQSEWWHFTLAREPYPDTYFDFPVDW